MKKRLKQWFRHLLLLSFATLSTTTLNTKTMAAPVHDLPNFDSASIYDCMGFNNPQWHFDWDCRQSRVFTHAGLDTSKKASPAQSAMPALASPASFLSLLQSANLKMPQVRLSTIVKEFAANSLPRVFVHSQPEGESNNDGAKQFTLVDDYLSGYSFVRDWRRSKPLQESLAENFIHADDHSQVINATVVQNGSIEPKTDKDSPLATWLAGAAGWLENAQCQWVAESFDPEQTRKIGRQIAMGSLQSSQQFQALGRWLPEAQPTSVTPQFVIFPSSGREYLVPASKVQSWSMESAYRADWEIAPSHGDGLGWNGLLSKNWQVVPNAELNLQKPTFSILDKPIGILDTQPTMAQFSTTESSTLSVSPVSITPVSIAPTWSQQMADQTSRGLDQVADWLHSVASRLRSTGQSNQEQLATAPHQGVH